NRRYDHDDYHSCGSPLMTSHSRDARVIDTVACPVCRAPRGAPYRRIASGTHTDRRKLWQMAQAGELAGYQPPERPVPTPRPWVAELDVTTGTWFLRTRYVPGVGATRIAEGLTEPDARLIVERCGAE